MSYEFERKSGPFHHLLLSHKPWALRPREASSVGFSSVATYLHWLGAECSRICCTLLATKTWKQLASFDTYPITTLLSVQKTYEMCSYSSSFLRNVLLITDTTAAVSSRLGIVTGFNGATRDLAITREL